MLAHARLYARIRLLRLAAALSLIVALAGLIARSRELVIAAIMLGGLALAGTAVAALPYLRRKKDSNDRRP